MANNKSRKYKRSKTEKWAKIRGDRKSKHKSPNYYSIAKKRLFLHLKKEKGFWLDSNSVQNALLMYCKMYSIQYDNKNPNWFSDILLTELFRKDSALYIDKQILSKQEKRYIERKEKKKTEVPLNNKPKSARAIEYEEYIKSYKWKSFSGGIKEKRGNKCEDCGKSGVVLHAHHLTYIRFMNELESDIKILCVPCHEKAHGRKFREYKK